MEKIRINNDIDIVVELKNEAGEVMQPQSLKNIAVVLSTGLKKHKVEDFTLLSNGVGFRFKASEQARTGVYDISVTAETADGRAFATDVCKAFELVARSCEAGGEAGEVEVESVNVAATFAITAWGGGADEERLEALEKGKQDKIEDLDAIRKGAKLGATALQEYYDDGSHEVVPVKHPDLSTQPNILPYKFAGNYVYEQMVWVDGEKFSDHNIGEIDLIKFQDYELDVKDAILIDHHVFIVGHGIHGNYVPLSNEFCFNIVSNDKKIVLKRSSGHSISCKGVWIRVVWTTGLNAGGYYYYDYNAPESKYNFYIKGFEGLSLSL